jgi:HSP20 family protein
MLNRNSLFSLSPFFSEVESQFPAFSGRNDFFNPAVEVKEEEKRYVVSLDVPGMKKEEIKLEIHENELNISGERRREETRNEKGSTYTERSYGKFKRSFSLPSNVEASKVEASYKDGTLNVFIPKTDEVKPKLIQIS